MYRAPRLAASALLALALAAPGCKYPYPGDVEDAANADDAKTVDAAGCGLPATYCDGDDVVTCTAGGQLDRTLCPYGCGHLGACLDMAPSNSLSQYLDQARFATGVLLNGTADIDTDTGRVTLDGAPVTVQSTTVATVPVEMMVLIANTFDAETVTVHGRRALAIMVHGDVRVRRSLSVGASGRGLGAGASDAMDPQCTAASGASDATGFAGAGGGGNGTAGGRGGNGGALQGGTPGSTLGNETLEPLRGGCPGGRAFGYAVDEAFGPKGGAGGGALQISTRGTIVLDPGASISASGAGGADFHPTFARCPLMGSEAIACNAGSGGGAGGGILLEATALQVPANAAITANGGAGHCGWRGTALDGTATEAGAPGTDCSGAAFTGAGSGGDGGAGVSSGFNGGAGAATGGGGGGGAGRIRINLTAGATFDPIPPVISPPPSIGRVDGRISLAQ